MKVDSIRAEFAAAILLREATRQFVSMYPGRYMVGDMPVQPLGAYPPAHQRALVAAVQRAIEAGTGEMEELFNLWLKEKQEIAAANAQAAQMQT